MSPEFTSPSTRLSRTVMHAWIWSQCQYKTNYLPKCTLTTRRRKCRSHASFFSKYMAASPMCIWKWGRRSRGPICIMATVRRDNTKDGSSRWPTLVLAASETSRTLLIVRSGINRGVDETKSCSNVAIDAPRSRLAERDSETEMPTRFKLHNTPHGLAAYYAIHLLLHRLYHFI